MIEVIGRWPAVALVMGLAACQATAPAATFERPTMPAVDTCGAAPYAHLIGQSGVALERTLIMRQIRILRDGEHVLGAVIPARINFHLTPVVHHPDSRPTRHVEVISAISCG